MLQLKDSIRKSAHNNHLQLDTHCSAFQSSALSQKVLISLRPCFLGTWLLLRLVLTALGSLREECL